ncbi:MAG: hypothetical protein QW117_01680 [Candidatus Pacearchaeota archaeon]
METKSYIEEIKRYLEKNLVKGYKLEDLKIQLKKQGYSVSAISRAIKELAEKSKEQQIKEIKKQEIKEEKVEPIKEEKIGFFSRLKKLFKI